MGLLAPPAYRSLHQPAQAGVTEPTSPGPGVPLTPAGDVQSARAGAGAMRMSMQALRGLRSAAGKMEPAGVVQGAGETVRGKEEQ